MIFSLICDFKIIGRTKILTTKIFALLFSGGDLDFEMWGGPSMTTTATGDGLIMTYMKGIYRFTCVSRKKCFFEKDKTKLQIWRKKHNLLTVPASLVEDC